ncbi:MAG: MarR family transcriptional regulator [Pseudomonadota bacterium]
MPGGFVRSAIETQFVVMMALWEADAVSISDLAARTGLSNPTMTPLLKRLERKKLLTLNRAEENDRQKIVTLTKAGRSLSAKSLPATEAAFCATGISKRQAADMIALCKRIVTHVDA